MQVVINIGGDILEKILVEKSQPLKGNVRISGAKNSALPLLAASLLGTEDIILENLPKLKDVEIMCEVLESLGCEVEFLEEDVVRINSANLNKYEQIIVQINKNSHLLRKYISEHNYTILDEDVVYDEFYYEIVVFNTNYHESYTNKEIEFGPVLLKKRSETFIEYMNYRAKQIKKIIEQAKLEDNPKLIELSKIEEIIKDA